MGAQLAHFCLQELHMPPEDFDNMRLRTKAFINASILVRREAEEKEQKKAKKRR